MSQSESDANELLALAEGEDFEDEYSELLQSLLRVKKEDERQKQDTVQELLREGRKAVDAKAADIYLQKELAAALQTPEKRSQLTGELDQSISYLQQCSINAAGVQFAVQQSIINVQLQENFQQQMHTAEEDLSPNLLAALTASQPALSLAARVAERVAAVEEKKRLLRERRVELALLHRSVTDLWKQKEHRNLSKNQRTDTEVMKEKREKLRNKEGQLDLLVHYIQSIMTGMSSRWGTDDRHLNVLKACELYKNSRQAVNWDRLYSLLASHHADESSD